MHAFRIDRWLLEVRRARARAWIARRCLLAVVLIGATLAWGSGPISAAAPAELISVNAVVPPADAKVTYYSPSVSGDGNVVVFSSGNFCDGCCGDCWAYVRDRAAGTTTAVPAPPNVNRNARGITRAVVSRDGCSVAFWAAPLTPNDPNFAYQYAIYLWNRCGATSPPLQQLSVPGAYTSANGAFPNALAISADGHYVAYAVTTASSPNSQIGRIDTGTNPPADDRLVRALGTVGSLDISDDGTYIAIEADRNTITSNEVDGWKPPCIFGLTRVPLCTMDIVSVAPSGLPATLRSTNPSVSADGRYVAFASNAPEFLGLKLPQIPQVYVRDRVAKVTKLVSTTPATPMPVVMETPEISPDGSQIALGQLGAPSAAGLPGVSQVFVARTTSGFYDSTVFDLVSFGTGGAPSPTGSINPSMSSNGRYVAFASSDIAALSGLKLSLTLDQVWMRQRPVALDITPSINFGNISAGTTSAPNNVVVTNTSNVPINISPVAAPPGPFSITASTCGGLLRPGATCRITLVFAPAVEGAVSSSLTVAGDGLSVAASLIGVGVAGSLKISPAVVNFGGTVVGTSLPSRKFVVLNIGQADTTITGVGLGAADADQFAITSNNCTGVLVIGATCTISVKAVVTRAGAMSATLRVTGAVGETGQATLRVSGLYQPVLTMNPGVVRPGQVSVAIGVGFPPNTDVQLSFIGEFPFVTVHTEADGTLRYSLLAIRNGVHHGVEEIDVLDQPGLFANVFAPLLIALGTFRPSGASGPAFTNGVTSMLSRG